jgi:hypothetical protein
MTELLPAAEPNSGGNSSGGNSNRSGKSQRRYRRTQETSTPIPDIEQILQMLLQLNAAVVLGVISTTKASIIQRNLRTILDVQTKRDGRGDTAANPETLVELRRHDPQVLNTLEPFLSDTQLDWLLDQIQDDQEGTEDTDGSV